MLNEILMQLGTIIGIALASAIMFLIKKLLISQNIKIKNTEINIKKELAVLAVKFVEQKFEQIENEKKFEEAAKWLSERLGEAGIRVSKEELEGLIESAVKGFKTELKK